MVYLVIYDGSAVSSTSSILHILHYGTCHILILCLIQFDESCSVFMYDVMGPLLCSCWMAQMAYKTDKKHMKHDL